MIERAFLRCLDANHSQDFKISNGFRLSTGFRDVPKSCKTFSVDSGAVPNDAWKERWALELCLLPNRFPIAKLQQRNSSR
jgi:hypothetical protein